MATMRLSRALDEIDCLSDMLDRLFDRAATCLTLPGLCGFSTEAVVQNLGRRTELFALITRQARPIYAQLRARSCTR